MSPRGLLLATVKHVPSTGDPARRRQLGTDMRTLVVTAWTLDRSRMVAQMALLVVAGLIGGAGLALLIPIVNAVAGPSDAITLPVVGAVGTGSLPLWVLLAAFVALVAGQALIQRAATVNSAQLQQRVVDRLRHDAFAAILRATGYPNLDAERYRLQIAAKSEGVRRTSSQWRSRIIEFVNNDYTAGKLLTHPVLTPNEVPGNWDTARQGAYTAPMGQGIPHPSSYLQPDFIPR